MIVLFRFSFCLLFLFSGSACTVYTVTNYSQQDFQIEVASDSDYRDLKADECIELTEYFLGIAGDFPFVIVGEDEERNVGHYEITSEKKDENQSQSQSSYKLSLSEKNLKCSSKPDKGEENKVRDTSTKENATKSNKSWNPAPEGTNVFCLSGRASCPSGLVAQCIIEKGGAVAVPACIKDETKQDSQVSCQGARPEDVNRPAKCLQAVSITVTAGRLPSCGGANTVAQCLQGGQVVCGKTLGAPVQAKDKAYCVITKQLDNATQYIRWTGEVTCANGVTPSC